MDDTEGSRAAWSLLERMQATVDGGDEQALRALFDGDGILVGTSAQARGREEIDAYLAAVVAQPGRLSWEWREVDVFHESPDVLGFAGFGEVVVRGSDDDGRAPFRLTILAVDGPDGWRIRQFHGSIPSDF